MNRSTLFSASTLLPSVTNLLLPGYCISCKLSLGNKAPQAHIHCLCGGCIRALPWLRGQCRQCAIPMPNNSLCGNCQLRPPPFRRCIAAFDYLPPVDKMIQRLKVDMHAPELYQLSKLLAQTISASYKISQRPNILIPIPLHWRKYLLRGFNQSHGIAHILSKQLPGTRVQADSCLRINHGKPQHLQGKQQRLKAMKGAFRAKRNKPLYGQAVALIDDVVTTGATARSAAQCLLDAGARSVDIWCIARTGWHIGAG